MSRGLGDVYKSQVEAAVQPVPVTDPRLRTAWPEEIYRITLHFRHAVELRLE